MSAIIGSCCAMANNVANTVVTNAKSDPDTALTTSVALSVLSIISYMEKTPPRLFSNPVTFEGNLMLFGTLGLASAFYAIEGVARLVFR